MNGIIIIPTFDRPEYLAVCLEHLYEAHGSENKEFWIREDIHADKPKNFTTEMEMLAVIRDAERKLGARLKYKACPPHTTYGNSYNVLSALIEAAHTDAKRVFLIEDDVLVTRDCLAWMEAALDLDPKIWAACAGRINRSLNFHLNGPDAIDESIKDTEACVANNKGAYISWATCFSRKALDHFKTMSVNYEGFRPGVEQDMMIQRLLVGNSFYTVWPFVPRAYHMGWYSYHLCGTKFYGTLEEKIAALKAAVSDPQKIREMANLQNIDPFPKRELSPFTALYLRRPNG